MTTFYTLNNKVYYVPVEAIPRLTDAMCEERVTRDGKSVCVVREELPDYLREIFDNLGRYTFQQLIPVIHNRSHPLLNLGDEALRKIVAYVGPYRGFLHQTCQAFFKRAEPMNNCLAMAGVGDLGMLRKMRPRKEGLEMICRAALRGLSCEDARLSVLNWLVEEKEYDINLMPFKFAAKKGDVKILEWAKNRTETSFTKSPLIEILTIIGTEYGQVAVLEWGYRYEAGLEDNSFFIRSLGRAAKNGHLEVLKWAHKNFIKICRTYIHTAARNGHLPILKWWHTHYKEAVKQDSVFFLEASGEGHLDILKWLVSVEARVDWGHFTVRNMGANALEAIAWASENGLSKEKINEYLAQLKVEKIA